MQSLQKYFYMTYKLSKMYTCHFFICSFMWIHFFFCSVCCKQSEWPILHIEISSLPSIYHSCLSVSTAEWLAPQATCSSCSISTHVHILWPQYMRVLGRPHGCMMGKAQRKYFFSCLVFNCRYLHGCWKYKNRMTSLVCFSVSVSDSMCCVPLNALGRPSPDISICAV